MRRLLAVLERIATALEQLVPALTQATREANEIQQTSIEYRAALLQKKLKEMEKAPTPPDPRYPEDGNV